MAGLELLINKETYLSKISLLDGKLSQLESLKERYTALLQSLDSDVVGSVDDNYANIEAGVRQNIKAITDAIRVTEAARADLQEVVTAHDQLTGAVGGLANSTSEAIGSTVEAAKSALKAAT